MNDVSTPNDGDTVRKPASLEVPSRIESLNARRRPPDGARPPAGRQIPAEDLDVIVRRAAEIQQKDGSPGSQLLSEEEVVEIGRQVGLEPGHVRRAMAEVHAESLAPQSPPGNRLLDLVAGTSWVEVRRVVAGDPTRVQQQIEMQLREQEKLVSLRRRPLRSVWEASGGVMHRLERSLNFSGKEYALAEARQVQLALAEIEPGWTLVTLGADLANKRDEVLYSAGGVIGFVAVFGAVFSGTAMGYAIVLAALVALLVTAISAAVGIPWMRWATEKRRNRVELILEGLLDRVDR